MHTTRKVVGLFVLALMGGQVATAQTEIRYHDPVEHISEAFSTAHLVAIGENHGHKELYDFLSVLLRDAAVQQAVDDIVVEFGNALYQPVLDRYIMGEAVPFDSVRLVWRNTVSSPSTVWDSPVYEAFFQTVREINADLPPEQRYRVLAGDPPIDWDRIESRDDLMPFFRRFRDEHFFEVVRTEVLGKGRKGLLLAGGLHMNRRNAVRERSSGLRWAEVTVASLIDIYYPGALYVVQSVGKEKLDYARLATLPRGVLVPIEGTWIGALEVNGITTLRNYDGSPMTMFGDARFQDMADAILYWGSPDELTYLEPPPQLYQDDAYWEELNRRSHIARDQPMNESLRQ